MSAYRTHAEVIPVDDLATLIADLARGGPAGDIIIAGGSNAPYVGDAIDLMTGTLNSWRAARHLTPIPTPRLLSPESWERLFLPLAEEHLSRRQLRILELLGNFEPYLALRELLIPTHPVASIEPCIQVSVRFWADAHASQAALMPREWAAAA